MWLFLTNVTLFLVTATLFFIIVIIFLILRFILQLSALFFTLGWKPASMHSLCCENGLVCILSAIRGRRLWHAESEWLSLHTHIRLTLRWDPEPCRRLASSRSSFEKISFIRQFKQSSYPPEKHQRVQSPPAALWHIYNHKHTRTHTHTPPNLTFTPIPTQAIYRRAAEWVSMCRVCVWVWYLIPVLCVHFTRCHVLEEQRQRFGARVSGCQV